MTTPRYVFYIESLLTTKFLLSSTVQYSAVESNFDPTLKLKFHIAHLSETLETFVFSSLLVISFTL
jgi:hypothetical protein